jgi:hypothetical protein
MGFGQPDQVQFVLLAFAQASLGIAAGPKLALRDIRETGYLHTDPEHLGLHRPIEKHLIPIVRGELNSKISHWRLSIQVSGEVANAAGSHDGIDLRA